jgi:hypothetical protein
MLAPRNACRLAAMHTCLSLANIGGHWYVERAVSDLIAKLGAHCDSIDWCNIAVEGPSGEDDEGSWRVDLKLRILDGVVRATTRLPEGPDPQQSLLAVLADVYAKATAQIAPITARSRVFV